MAWKLNEPGAALNQSGFTLNGGGFVATIKQYYTGGIALAKALLRRGLGF